MRSRTVPLLAVAALLGLACAGNRVQVPPRVDLTRYRTVGMLGFSSQGSEALARQATDRFLAVVQGAQPGVPILELGDVDQVLASLQRDRLDPETIQAIGARYDVDAVLVGEFQAQTAQPRFSVTSLQSMSADASLEGVLSARLLHTRNGATLWKNAARGSQSLASVNLSGGLIPQVSGQDRETAESALVRSLVATLTDDFRPRWVRQ